MAVDRRKQSGNGSNHRVLGRGRRGQRGGRAGGGIGGLAPWRARGTPLPARDSQGTPARHTAKRGVKEWGCRRGARGQTAGGSVGGRTRRPLAEEWWRRSWLVGLGVGCKLLSEVVRWRNTGARHARRGLVSAHAALLVSAVSNQVIARLMRPCHLLRARIDKVPPTVANGGTRGRGWCQSRRRRAHLGASVPLTSWRTPSR